MSSGNIRLLLNLPIWDLEVRNWGLVRVVNYGVLALVMVLGRKTSFGKRWFLALFWLILEFDGFKFLCMFVVSQSGVCTPPQFLRNGGFWLGLETSKNWSLASLALCFIFGPRSSSNQLNFPSSRLIYTLSQLIW